MEHKSTILIVDDHLPVRKTIEAFLKPYDYDLVFVEDGIQAVEAAPNIQPDLILLDVMMPMMGGFEVLRKLRNDSLTKEIPIIMITALDDKESRLSGLETGADDYLTKPIDRSELVARVRTITRLNRYRSLMTERAKFERLIEISPDGIVLLDSKREILLVNQTLTDQLQVTNRETLLHQNLFDFIPTEHHESCVECFRQVISAVQGTQTVEAAFRRTDGTIFPAEINVGHFVLDNQPTAQIIVRDITERKESEKALQMAHKELTNSYEATLEGWVRALDLRDDETKGHTQRVTSVVLKLAESMGISAEELEAVRRGALMHDIGKIGIPDQILHKPGKLTDDEWVIMRQHPVHAYNMIAPIPYLQSSIDIPYCHHEKWDGSGYPRGLKGEGIPLAARLFAVVDVWDALISDRPYRAAWPEEKALAYIQEVSGSHFDPAVVEKFMELHKLGKVVREIR
jgi:PAS domain S-box-containing protein